MMWIRAAGGTWHVLEHWKRRADTLRVDPMEGVTKCGRRLIVIHATDDESKMKGERCKLCQAKNR